MNATELTPTLKILDDCVESLTRLAVLTETFTVQQKFLKDKRCPSLVEK
jgi:hypothetical protein